MSAMYDNQTYHSRSEEYKYPYGAVTPGTVVELKLRPLRREGFSRGKLIARFEADNDRIREYPMTWTDTSRGIDVFSGRLPVGDYVGLIWYSFQLTGLNGQYQELGPYQLTVYDPTDRVPDWFGKGMCYQIFPDRFHRSRVPSPMGMVGGRTVHGDWNSEPEWRPNERGEVRNRDFFGGDLKGIQEKLDYIASLGVETIYFCPIFEAAENHRYGTADYDRVDPMLGTNEDFKALCDAAHERGIRVILDGVFNHTGYVSRYFNGDGYYPGDGAKQSKESPYYDWFCFTNWPNEYESWWGIYSLPAVNEHCPSYREFIFGGENSVVRKWLRAGADGWRLDVADELPDDFIYGLHQAVREENPEAVVIGEVWEDGSNKVAYGVRRKHLLGNHLDGLMNYPFRSALIDFLLGGDGADFRERMETLRENYPPFAFYSAMNALGTHDTLRILTYLGTGSQRYEWSKETRSTYVMTGQERELGWKRLQLGLAVLFAFPGAPTVYYGDEAGMTGFEDPFNRRPYPWGNEDQEVLAYYREMGRLRKENECLRSGGIIWGDCPGQVVSFARTLEDEALALAVNAGDTGAEITIPWAFPSAKDLDSGEAIPAENGRLTVTVSPMGRRLLRFREQAQG
ncbi:MAG: glycoside hydrolase family 13 protein [Clostridiales bacterium]|nr:glycoside hydrolase family 13 protein [Clostridiales bacterium]